MKIDELNTYSEEVIDQFLHRPIRCPYHKGKMQLSKITKRTKQKIVDVITSMKGADFSHMNYDQLVEQNNQEKNIEYQLSHDVITLWVDQAYALLEPEIPHEIGLHDLYKIAYLSAEDAMQILGDLFARINLHIQTNNPEVYAAGDEYGLLKKQLAARGCRKAQQGRHQNMFEQLTETPVRSQLIVQTIPYIQHVLQTHREEDNFFYALKEAKAPKSWYFLADLGHLIRLVRDRLPGGEHLPGGVFYDEQETYGISAEAKGHLDKFTERFAEGTFNHIAYEALEGEATKHLMFPEEHTYGCPVKDSFTKFFRITVTALYQAVEKKEIPPCVDTQ